MRSIRRNAALFPVLILIGFVLLTAFLLSVVDNVSGYVVAEVIIAALLSIWYSKRLLRPLETLEPTLDAHGHIEFPAHDTEAPIELAALRTSLQQIATRQRQQSQERERLERVRSEFLANVSHELRTPIFAVQGFIETLLDGAIDDPKVNREFLERARVQAERLNTLLSDLIDISRIESGEMRMSFRVFDIEPLLRDVLNELKPQASSKDIHLILSGNVSPHKQIAVYADRDRIKQVLINLIDNAIKYSGQGSTIRLDLLKGVPTNEEITVRVSDNGIGIDMEHLPRLFERFYRVNKDRSRSSPGGTGLGLAIVKHIVEAHRGKITVHSTIGEGSQFEFTLHTEPF